jgi:hypothetical protein
MLRNLAHSGLKKNLLQTKQQTIPSEFTPLYNLFFISLVSIQERIFDCQKQSKKQL